jgi:hypothetical protein
LGGVQNAAGDDKYGYDRIVCDVPCSGDGTLRKCPEMWKDWTPREGMMLHSIQLQIAMRGASLLRVGGLMVYSTCTFNPIENEAVVAEILRRSKGSLYLIDAHSSSSGSGSVWGGEDGGWSKGVNVGMDMLPGIQARPGISEWVVGDFAAEALSAMEAATASTSTHKPAASEDGSSAFTRYRTFDECMDRLSSGARDGAAYGHKKGRTSGKPNGSSAQDGGRGGKSAKECMLAEDRLEFLKKHRQRFRRSMFQPGAAERVGGKKAGTGGLLSEQLRRCIRLYPHLTDTGGFFVAAFCKRAPMPSGKTSGQQEGGEEEEEEAAAATGVGEEEKDEDGEGEDEESEESEDEESEDEETEDGDSEESEDEDKRNTQAADSLPPRTVVVLVEGSMLEDKQKLTLTVGCMDGLKERLTGQLQLPAASTGGGGPPLALRVEMFDKNTGAWVVLGEGGGEGLIAWARRRS